MDAGGADVEGGALVQSLSRSAARSMCLNAPQVALAAALIECAVDAEVVEDLRNAVAKAARPRCHRPQWTPAGQSAMGAFCAGLSSMDKSWWRRLGADVVNILQSGAVEMYRSGEYRSGDGLCRIKHLQIPLHELGLRKKRFLAGAKNLFFYAGRAREKA